MKVTKSKSRALVALALGLGLFLAQAGSVYAAHCYVADKPEEAGAVGPGDLKVAGASGQLVAPGAFADLDAFGAPITQDVFIRGPEPLPAEAPPIVGGGSLPEQPHMQGSSTKGVLELE